MEKDSQDYVDIVTMMISGGEYEATQQMGGGEEEPYEGCEHNILDIFENSEKPVIEVPEGDPHYRERQHTYRASFQSWLGYYTIYIRTLREE